MNSLQNTIIAFSKQIVKNYLNIEENTLLTLCRDYNDMYLQLNQKEFLFFYKEICERVKLNNILYKVA